MIAGGGAAGMAIVRLLLLAGAEHILVWDREGILAPTDEPLSPAKADLQSRRIQRASPGDLRRALRGADVFIVASGPGVLQLDWLEDMAKNPIVFALANPDPEVDLAAARSRVAVLAPGRSDHPNQINNVLAFPGVFRGLLESQAKEITVGMLLQAAAAIAECVTDEQLNPTYIVPSVFDPVVASRVGAAIKNASTQSRRGQSRTAFRTRHLDDRHDDLLTVAELISPNARDYIVATTSCARTIGHRPAAR